MPATSRIADVSINTVTKQLENVGVAWLEFHDATVRNIKSKRVQCDVIWSFYYPNEKNVAPEYKCILGHRDAHTWTPIDSDTKLAISLVVGRRDVEFAEAFTTGLASRQRWKPELRITSGRLKRLQG